MEPSPVDSSTPVPSVLAANSSLPTAPPTQAVAMTLPVPVQSGVVPTAGATKALVVTAPVLVSAPATVVAASVPMKPIASVVAPAPTTSV